HNPWSNWQPDTPELVPYRCRLPSDSCRHEFRCRRTRRNIWQEIAFRSVFPAYRQRIQARCRHLPPIPTCSVAQTKPFLPLSSPVSSLIYCMVRENDECLQHANCAASTGHNNVQLYRGQQATAATSSADASERDNVNPEFACSQITDF